MVVGRDGGRPTHSRETRARPDVASRQRSTGDSDRPDRQDGQHEQGNHVLEGHRPH